MEKKPNMNCIRIICPLLLVLLTTEYVEGNGIWQSWAAWSQCTESCEGGVQRRNRVCIPIQPGDTCNGDAEAFRICNSQECPVNGTWTEWTEWTTCSKSCGGGIHERSRECVGQQAGGYPCEGEEREEATCNTIPCPVDGQWSTWAAYGACSVTCGGGFRSRDRTCTSPSPAYGGEDCVGEDTESGECEQQACPGNEVVHGNWGPWTLFTACNTSCSEGTKTRSRSCSNPLPANGGSECPNSNTEEIPCNLGNCPIDGNWTSWSTFSACSVTCGGGIRYSVRTCADPPPQYNGNLCDTSSLPENVSDVTGKEGLEQRLTVNCSTDDCQPVNGSWSVWHDVYRCSVSCGSGVQRRMRRCDDPPTQNGGEDCEVTEPANTTINGVVVEYKTFVCTPGPTCPIHGEWQSWSPWSSCPVTCGTGAQQRTRTCTPPAHGGQTCEGLGNETQDCATNVCDVDGAWSLWSSWAGCSATCGGGNQTRTRTCSNPPPSGQGANCTGLEEEIQACNTQVCPSVDGGWSSWEPWGQCSMTCGGEGRRARLRTCDNPEPERGGADCRGTNIYVEPCNNGQCRDLAIAGGWGQWGAWSKCSEHCGTGSSTRERLCDRPAPSRGGTPCLREANAGSLWYPDDFYAEETERNTCNTHKCSIDGQWGPWSPWSQCTKTCGGGMKRRYQRCDSPAPANGGRPCPHPSRGANITSELAACNREPCGNYTATTPTPLSTTTIVRQFCEQENAYDGLKWPRTEVGTQVSLPCIAPSVGDATRRCDAENQWGTINTAACKTADHQNLQNVVYYAARHADNMTALTEATNLLEATCTKDTITLIGQLLECVRAVNRLVTILRNLKDPDLRTLYYKLLQVNNELLDPKLKEIWDSNTINEEGNYICTLCELTQAVIQETIFVAEYLQSTRGPAYCPRTAHITCCTEPVTCDSTGYRYPPKPPTPTPPNRHIRGGYDPPDVEITHVNIPAVLYKAPSCYEKRKRRRISTTDFRSILLGLKTKRSTKRVVQNAQKETTKSRNNHTQQNSTSDLHQTKLRDQRIPVERSETRKKRQVNNNDLLSSLFGNTTSNVPQEKMVPRYPVTVVFSTLHELLPDMDKQPYIPPKKEPDALYIPVEDMHVINAKVVASTIVGETGLLNQSVTYSVRFYHLKEGRDPICAEIDMDNRDIMYNTLACNLSYTSVNYSVCECSPKEGAFVLLMKPGIIRTNFTYVVIDDVFLKYSCYIGVAIHVLAIIILLFIGLWDVDRHWVVINFCISTVIYQLFVVVGMRWVNYDHTCYFMSWLVHFATLVNISWVLGLGGLCFKQVHDTYPLSTKERLFYAAICWLIPVFIAIIPTALRHGYVNRDYFCWLSGAEYTLLAFFIPLLVIAVVALVFLLLAYNMNTPMMKVRLNGEVPDYTTRKRYLRALLVFLLIVTLNLLMLGLNVGIAFLITNIAQCLFVALIFILLNEDVQSGYGNKKDRVEEFIRLKKEQQGDGPDLQAGRHDGDPEWVQQTRTAPMVTIDLSSHNEPRRIITKEEEAKAARRERRRRKKLEAQKPVYIPPTRQQQLLLPQASRPAPRPTQTTSRAAAYAPEAPAAHEQTEMLEMEVKPTMKRSRTRQRTRNMMSD